MMELLSAPARDVLAGLSRSRSLLVFDFDGTLSPIVADRDAAVMRPRTATALRALCALYPCAILSGRSRDDVASRIGGAEPLAIIGNHGIEGGPVSDVEDARLRACAAAARAVVAPLVASLVGVDVEDKGSSLAIHYRAAPDPRAAREAVLFAAARCVSTRVVEGKCVVNVVPAGAPDKGHALVYLRARTGAEEVLFVGDDVTDEDAFALEVTWLVSVKVGASGSSLATYLLPRQDDVDELIERLVALRSQQGAPPTGGRP